MPFLLNKEYIYVQLDLKRDFMSSKVSEQTPERNMNQDFFLKTLRGEDTLPWKPSLSSPSSAFSRFSLFLRLWRSSSSVLTTGCIPLLPRARALCLFPKRPMGLTPRPTYQNGSISGPGAHRHKYGRHYISKQAFKYNDVETKMILWWWVYFVVSY